MLKLMMALMLAVVSMALVACASSDKSTAGGAAGAGVSMDAIKGDWPLTHIRGEAINLPADARGPYITFDPEGRVSGMGGVNRFMGAFDKSKLSDGKLTFGPLAMTMMAGPEPLMQMESQFGAAADQVRRVRLEGNELFLTDDAGAELLRFKRYR